MDLSHNRIKSISEVLVGGKGSGLRMLNLGGNCIEKIGWEICELGKLEVLDLSGNGFGNLPVKLFSRKSCLGELRLDWCEYLIPKCSQKIGRYSKARAAPGQYSVSIENICEYLESCP